MNLGRYMAVLSPNAPAQPWLEDMRQEQVASTYRNILVGIAPTWIAAAVLAILLVQQQAVAPTTVAVWFAVITLLTLARIVLAVVYARTHDDARRNWRKWGAWFTAGATSSGVAW